MEDDRTGQGLFGDWSWSGTGSPSPWGPDSFPVHKIFRRVEGGDLTEGVRDLLGISVKGSRRSFGPEIRIKE